MEHMVHILHTGHATLLEQLLKKIDQEKGVGQELALLPIAAVMFRPRVRHRFSLQPVLLQGGSVIALIILTQLALTINGV